MIFVTEKERFLMRKIREGTSDTGTLTETSNILVKRKSIDFEEDALKHGEDTLQQRSLNSEQ